MSHQTSFSFNYLVPKHAAGIAMYQSSNKNNFIFITTFPEE